MSSCNYISILSFPRIRTSYVTTNSKKLSVSALSVTKKRIINRDTQTDMCVNRLLSGLEGTHDLNMCPTRHTHTERPRHTQSLLLPFVSWQSHLDISHTFLMTTKYECHLGLRIPRVPGTLYTVPNKLHVHCTYECRACPADDAG